MFALTICPSSTFTSESTMILNVSFSEFSFTPMIEISLPIYSTCLTKNENDPFSHISNPSGLIPIVTSWFSTASSIDPTISSPMLI